MEAKQFSPKKIGVVVAVEMAAVEEKYGRPESVLTVRGYRVLRYEQGERELFFLESGAGEIASAGGAQVLISDLGAELILNFGVVGSLTEEIKTAELCVVEAVTDADFGSDGWLNLPRGQHPEDEGVYMETDRDLLARALQVNPKLTVVRCASTNSFQDDPADKRKLQERFGADICEMEAAGILRTCRRCGVPCLLIKAVSDSLLGGGMEFLEALNRVSLMCFDTLDEILQGL